MITAIVLAAGASSRMGRPKMLLPFGQSTVLESVIAALKRPGINMIRVVVGYDREAVAGVVAGAGTEIIVNPAPERGMLSSIQCAMASSDSGGYLIVLGDQPHLQPQVIDVVVSTFRQHSESIIVPVFEGKRGHPIIVSARFREAILELPATVGLNTLLQRHPEALVETMVTNPGILKDIDTPADYENILREAG